MPSLVQRRWEPDPEAYGGRRSRAPFTYHAFVPDPIADADPLLPVSTYEAITAAESALDSLNEPQLLAGLEAVGPLLLRSEAVASSRIEGIELSQRNLARALVEPRSVGQTARAVAANVTAMEEAIALGEDAAELSIDDILRIHGTLMAGEHRANPGELRTVQNWVGGRLNNPLDAAFVPPPETELGWLMADLLKFVSRNDLPATAQAAIAHAQFETIHPFVDGNGRVGRCLIHVVLRGRGATAFVPPISVVLAARPDKYISGLVAFREGRVAEWCESFASALERAAVLSANLAQDITKLQAEWYERAGRPRRDSSAARVIEVLPAQPITSAATIRAAIGARHQRALEGLRALETARVVRKVSESSRDQQFAADELFELMERYEEEMSR